jgi:hypothetical protein
MSEPRLQWSAAEVRGGKLAVPIEGDMPDGWRDTFAKTIQLLDAGDWAAIKVKKQGVRVTGVTRGSEERLRHLLEGAVQEANATHVSADERDEDNEDDEHDAAGEGADPTDADMTERFRSFASQV